MEALIGWILIVGVWLSAALLAAGTIWHAVRTGSPMFAYTLSPSNLFQFWLQQAHAVTGDVRPRLLTNAGLAVLMLTPYLRVGASAVYFATTERNAKYAVLAGTVFLILTYSLFMK